MRRAQSVAAAAVAGALALFAARRVALLAGALSRPRPLPPPGSLPSVTFVVAARDEERNLARLLEALERLDYPAEQLFTVLVDDGSADGTLSLLDEWSSRQQRSAVVSMPSAPGKGAALNAGIEAAPPSSVIVVCDADLVPDPSCLRALVRPLGDPDVAAVAGYRRPANADATLVARYAALEAWVMQLVTSAGKDRLGLDPPLLGFGAFRREALAEIGGFRSGVHGEDVLATAALAAAGRHTRFAPDAIANDRVVEELSRYLRQHVRWQGNSLDALRAGRPDVETLLLAAGYADRPLLVAAALLLPWQVPAGYLGIRLAESAVAARKAGAGLDHLVAAIVLFPVDVAASVAAFLRRRETGGWATQR